MSTFTSNDVNATIGVQVRGDVIIRPGNTYNNIGTGTEIWGDVYMDGTGNIIMAMGADWFFRQCQQHNLGRRDFFRFMN